MLPFPLVDPETWIPNFKREEIRLRLSTKRPVRVLQVDWDEMAEDFSMIVQDLIERWDTSRLTPQELGPVISEMEAIAWSAKA